MPHFFSADQESCWSEQKSMVSSSLRSALGSTTDLNFIFINVRERRLWPRAKTNVSIKQSYGPAGMHDEPKSKMHFSNHVAQSPVTQTFHVGLRYHTSASWKRSNVLWSPNGVWLDNEWDLCDLSWLIFTVMFTW